jgi:transcriptional regulator
MRDPDENKGENKDDRTGVWQGTLALMVLTTLASLGPQHGFGIARRIEQTSGDRLSVNPGTLYPTLLKLEQEGFITSKWGVSDNSRRARFYQLTRAGRTQLERETRQWQTTSDIIARFLDAARARRRFARRC